MTARILDGKAIAGACRAETRNQVRARTARGLPPPGLAVILIGDNPASAVYVRNKQRACDEVGFLSYEHVLPKDTTQKQLDSLLRTLNEDPTVDGILVQLPLPSHLDVRRVQETIAPAKDVDGFHPFNTGRLALGAPTLRPCTPWGVMRLLSHTGEPLAGREAVVVGQSNIVGRPMALELLAAGATVTVCHSKTRNLAAHVARADLIVAAAGCPALVRGEWICEGAIVVDVGINRLPDGHLSGDVDFAGASQRASWITPVPGGVGPMTIAMLLENTLTAAQTRTAASA